MNTPRRGPNYRYVSFDYEKAYSKVRPLSVYTYGQVGFLLGIKRTSLYNLVKGGLLRVVDISLGVRRDGWKRKGARSIRVLGSDLEEFLSRWRAREVKAERKERVIGDGRGRSRRGINDGWWELRDEIIGKKKAKDRFAGIRDREEFKVLVSLLLKEGGLLFKKDAYTRNKRHLEGADLRLRDECLRKLGLPGPKSVVSKEGIRLRVVEEEKRVREEAEYMREVFGVKVVGKRVVGGGKI